MRISKEERRPESRRRSPGKSDQPGIFRSASDTTLNLLKTFLDEEINTFLIPTGFISPEAGQVGYLLNEYFNQGRSGAHRLPYKTFFVNSRIEALHGAIKIARAKSLMRNRPNRETVIYDASGQLQRTFDPLELGMERALVPGIRFFREMEELERYRSELSTAPAALILWGPLDLSVDRIDDLIGLCRQFRVTSILDESMTDFVRSQPVIQQVSRLPDVVITGETLTDNEIPFAAFSMSERTFLPWNHRVTCFSHISTCGGNRLSLNRVRDRLLSEIFSRDTRHLAAAQCKYIADSDDARLTSFIRFVNPALVEVFRKAGLELNPLKAHGSILTVAGKGREREILDCAAGGGLSARGHTPADIVPEVLAVHDRKRDYWQELSGRLSRQTGLAHAFPAVSGSTAVEIAMILAVLANSEKTRIVVFKGNYAGSGLLSLIGTEAENFRKPFFPLYYDVLYIDPFSPRADEILLKELISQKVALVWFEVFQGQGARSIPRDLLDLIGQHREKGGYLVGVDEVLTGIYRLGTFLAAEGRVDRPDIVTLFKGLTDNTFPCGATMVSEDVYRRARRAAPQLVSHMERFYVNQLGAHIALHLLDRVDTLDLGRHVKKVAAILKEGFAGIAAASPLVTSVDGDGLLYNFNYDYNTRLLRLLGKRSRPVAENLFPLFMCKRIRDKGLTLLYFSKCTPSLALGEEEARLLLKRLEKIMTGRWQRFTLYFGFPLRVFREVRTLRRESGKRRRLTVGQKLKAKIRVFRGITSAYVKSLFRKKDVADFYTELGDDVFETLNENFQNPSKSLWHNNGYWKEARTYPEACQALARLVAESAELGSEDRVLDVGFGYGEQDVYWLKEFDVKEILGINITPLHVEVGQRRVKELKLDKKIRLQLGSGTYLQYEDESFDKVVSLESPFHFNTREKFFQEAFRVLRPGGKLAVTDMLPSPGGKTSGLRRRIGRKLVCIPEANMYDRHVYARKLEEAGFKNVTVTSIAPYVFPGSTKYFKLRKLRSLGMESTVVELTEEEIRTCYGAADKEKDTGISDYIVASAEKP